MNVKIIYLKKKMLKNFQHQWTVRKMAETVDVTPAHLQKIFKVATGMSPMNCLRDLRLEKAKELLEKSLMYIHIICWEVGIKDQSHFTRDFKNKYGSTPTEYRQTYYEKIEVEDTNG